jgi:diacylglycerol kinase family enzyme
MRALLVVNTFATTTSESVRDVIAAALSNSLDLDIVHTSGRGDAIAFGASARAKGYELVIGLGGDGTLNELANGILQDGPDLTGPILAAVPGGNANVFARNLGLPNDAVEATAQLLNSIEQKSIHTIGVGQIETDEVSRWFLFNAGFGLDAAVLAQMEERRANGKAASDLAYAAFALRELFTRTDRRNPTLRVLEDSGVDHPAAYFALIVNLAPWSYLGPRPLNPMPAASLETSLDVYAPTSLTLRAIAKLTRNIVAGRSLPESGDVIALHDLTVVGLESTRDLWVQVDGDVVAQSKILRARHVPNALRVLA